LLENLILIIFKESDIKIVGDNTQNTRKKPIVECLDFQIPVTLLGRFVGVRVDVAYSRNKLALRTRLRNPNLQSQFSIFDHFRDIRVHTYDFLKFVGDFWAVRWAWQTIFWVN